MNYRDFMKTAAFFLILAAFGAGTAHGATATQNYRFYCAACHGLEGRGDGPNNNPTQPVRPRNHTNAAKMSQLTDEDLIHVIKEGGAATNRSRMMPPFGDTLTDREIRDLRDYLRELCKCTAQ